MHTEISSTLIKITKISLQILSLCIVQILDTHSISELTEYIGKPFNQIFGSGFQAIIATESNSQLPIITQHRGRHPYLFLLRRPETAHLNRRAVEDERGLGPRDVGEYHGGVRGEMIEDDIVDVVGKDGVEQTCCTSHAVMLAGIFHYLSDVVEFRYIFHDVFTMC